jgi:hypothetical protein
MRDASSARLALLSVIVGAYAAACAADAGDSSKIGSTLTPAGPSADAALANDATSADESPAYAGSDGQTMEETPTSPPADAGTAVIEDSSAPETTTLPDTGSSPDVGMGAGCAAGAVVITLPAGQANSNTGNFGTVGPVCVELMGSVHQGWGLSNENGRMLTLTSSTGTTAPIDATLYASLPAAPQAGPDGFVYWNFTSGTYPYASLYIF